MRFNDIDIITDHFAYQQASNKNAHTRRNIMRAQRTAELQRRTKREGTALKAVAFSSPRKIQAFGRSVLARTLRAAAR